ncbi:hypothetical protein GNF10_23620 [Nostoc sp. UCD121]|uniref:hypothetical protein n=1 Tax=unclassified Nostoc TaxID=2593658 RepID=UPI001627F6BC|nr:MULTISPECIES: hypothetical protein [unclassified Nostoc]MBC1221288.1 hypothetical protein [Nostoc sp. UCD120]MBC1278872.1 hypothetical protein [Nostoc sp. UCD121]MBC1296176.1 hypothetical protein [Nostoc sp. UCD122]
MADFGSDQKYVNIVISSLCSSRLEQAIAVLCRRRSLLVCGSVIVNQTARFLLHCRIA